MGSQTKRTAERVWWAAVKEGWAHGCSALTQAVAAAAAEWRWAEAAEPASGAAVSCAAAAPLPLGPSLLSAAASDWEAVANGSG